MYEKSESPYKAFAQNRYNTNTYPNTGVCAVVVILSFRLRDWGVTLCTFGIRVVHGVLQNAIRLRSCAWCALRVLLLRWRGIPRPFPVSFA